MYMYIHVYNMLAWGHQIEHHWPILAAGVCKFKKNLHAPCVYTSIDTCAFLSLFFLLLSFSFLSLALSLAFSLSVSLFLSLSHCSLLPLLSLLSLLSLSVTLSRSLSFARALSLSLSLSLFLYVFMCVYAYLCKWQKCLKTKKGIGMYCSPHALHLTIKATVCNESCYKLYKYTNTRVCMWERISRTTQTTLPNRLRSGPKLPSLVISDRTEAYSAKWSESFDLSVPTKS